MLQKLQKILSTSLLLRIGLAFVFIYAAIAAFIDPKEWIGYLPNILTENFNSGLLLKLFSTGELFLAAWLLSGIYTRFAALTAAAMLAGITLSNLTIFVVTFRDIGLIFAALGLATLDNKQKASNPAKLP